MIEKQRDKDKFGRPLPIPSWVDTPTETGLYYYTSRKEDWDIARPVGVYTVTTYGYEGDIVEFIGNFYCENRYGVSIRDLPREGRWFGPFKMVRPEWDYPKTEKQVKNG